MKYLIWAAILDFAPCLCPCPHFMTIVALKLISLTLQKPKNHLSVTTEGKYMTYFMIWRPLIFPLAHPICILDRVHKIHFTQHTIFIWKQLYYFGTQKLVTNSLYFPFTIMSNGRVGGGIKSELTSLSPRKFQSVLQFLISTIKYFILTKFGPCKRWVNFTSHFSGGSGGHTHWFWAS